MHNVFNFKQDIIVFVKYIYIFFLPIIIYVVISSFLIQCVYFSKKDHSSQSHLEFRIQELTDENHRLNERIENDNSVLQKNNNVL